jgi:hypothetical protein
LLTGALKARDRRRSYRSVKRGADKKEGSTIGKEIDDGGGFPIVNKAVSDISDSEVDTVRESLTTHHKLCKEKGKDVREGMRGVGWGR